MRSVLARQGKMAALTDAPKMFSKWRFFRAEVFAAKRDAKSRANSSVILSFWNRNHMATTVNLLVDAREAATLCGMSRAAWYKQLSSGKIPRPVKIGSISRWRRRELERWIDAGCPARQKWETLQSNG
jgi:predicted DNA-binding transcriptional regulator AlpA